MGLRCLPCTSCVFLLLTVMTVNAVMEPVCNATSHDLQKRYVLSFPVNGGVAKILFGFVCPVRFGHKLMRIMNMGYNLQANYRILPKIIFPHYEAVWKNRYQEDYVDSSRKQLYKLLERILDSWGRNGKVCLLRTVCEVADTPLSHNGMIGELMDIIFTPSANDDTENAYTMARKYGMNGVDCARVYDECPYSHGLLDSITKLH